MTEAVTLKSAVCPGCAQVVPIDNHGCTSCGYEDNVAGRILSLGEIMALPTHGAVHTFNDVTPAFVAAVVRAAQGVDGLIGPVIVKRDDDGWWQHPELPSFAEVPDAFRAWLLAQGLEVQQWSMERDGDDGHPYWDVESPRHDCLGWEPRSPGPDWFLLSIVDSEDGPFVNWVRRVTADV